MRDDCSEYISSLTDFEKDRGGLKTDFAKRFRLFRDFVRRRVDPQDSFVSIHVAGSKGKGSVCHILSGLLRTRLNKVGLFTSPHLLDVRERIRINGTPISRADFMRYAEKVRRLSERDGARLTYFEFLTFLSFLYFRDRNVDIAVYETGLGGRLDATNVLTPAAAVITLVEKEHTDILGKTVEKIAAEKLGILKRGVPVFCQEQSPSVRQLARRTAAGLDCALFEEGTAFWTDESFPARGGRAFIHSDALDNGKIRFWTPMPNPVQARNISLAFFIARWMFPAADVGRMIRFIGRFSVPARFEVIRKKPAVIFDPCHTVSSFQALIATLEGLYPLSRVVIYISLFRDKDIRSVMKLLRSGGIRKIVWLDNPNPRSLTVGEARRLVPGLRSIPLQGLDMSTLAPGFIHVFTGSFSVYPFIKIS